MSVTGSASVGLEHINGVASGGKSWYMGNQLTFTGGGELDNGMNVTLSFVIDQGDDTKSTANSATSVSGSNAPFDNHSVAIGMDIRTVTFHVKVEVLRLLLWMVLHR